MYIRVGHTMWYGVKILSLRGFSLYDKKEKKIAFLDWLNKLYLGKWDSKNHMITYNGKMFQIYAYAAFQKIHKDSPIII